MKYNRVIRVKEILAKFAFTKAFFYSQIRNGLWPKPFKISNRLVGWLDTEVDAMLEAMVKGFDENQVKTIASEIEKGRTSN